MNKIIRISDIVDVNIELPFNIRICRNELQSILLTFESAEKVMKAMESIESQLNGINSLTGKNEYLTIENIL
jgi:hypothetical protein